MKPTILRKLIFNINNHLNPRMDFDEANILLQEKLNDDRPLMVARFGAVEIKSLIYSILPPPY